jgi:hypothetical protein
MADGSYRPVSGAGTWLDLLKAQKITALAWHAGDARRAGSGSPEKSRRLSNEVIASAEITMSLPALMGSTQASGGAQPPHGAADILTH